MIKDNKGFMMAEVVVVSSIVLIFLTTIFTSYNKLYAAYVNRINYYDVVTLYRLGYYRDILIENDKINSLLTNNTVEIYNSGSINNLFNLPSSEIPQNQEDRVFLINNKKNKLSGNELDSFDIKPTFSDYMSYLSTSATIKSNYVMIMERCEKNGDTININDCKYAYLEIYDGKE